MARRSVIRQFVDSAGIQAMITVCQEPHGGRPVLRSPAGEVAKVLELITAGTFPNLAIDRDGVPR